MRFQQVFELDGIFGDAGLAFTVSVVERHGKGGKVEQGDLRACLFGECGGEAGERFVMGVAARCASEDENANSVGHGGVDDGWRWGIQGTGVAELRSREVASHESRVTG